MQMHEPYDPRSLCVVSCAGLKLAKTHHYQNGVWAPGKTVFPALVDAAETPALKGVGQLSTAVEFYSTRQNVAIVRGFIGSGKGVPKKCVGGPSPDAPFAECDRQWVMVDIDKLPLPDGEATDDKAAVAYAVSMLPECFQGASYHYHFSAGYRISKPGTVSVHLWYWLDRPVCCTSLRAYAKANPPFDAALYNPVHLHFTADPTIIGAPDPVVQRSGFRPGAPAVVLPDTVLDLATYKATKADEDRRQAEERQRHAQAAKYNPRADGERGRYAEGAVQRILRDLSTAPEGNRHRAIVHAAYRIGSLNAYLDSSVVTVLEANAIALLPADRKAEAIRTVRQCFEAGARDPADLSHIGSVLRR
jgi:hypothetical protein